MKTCLCILILTAASVVGACGYRTWQLLGEARSAVKVATVTAASVDGRAKEALALIREAVIKADVQIAGLRSDVRPLLSSLSNGISSTSKSVDSISNAVEHVAGVRDDLKPTLANLAATTHDLRPQLLGLVAGWKVVGGETAQTMRNIQRATPEAIHSFQAIQGSVKDTSQSIATGFPKIVNNTGGIAENINRITKPRWWETPLKAAVAGAVVAGALK